MRKEMESQNRGLYRESFEHDNCGIGAIVNIKGKKTHSTVAGALSIVEQLEHRAGKDAEGKTGDGVGILTQIPHGFFKKVCQPLGIKLKDERDYRGYCKKRRIEVLGLERSSDSSGHSWKDSSRLHAMYYAGIY